MAYKFSIGDYSHSGSISATTAVSGTTGVSGSTGTFGTLTVATFSPTNISATNITASTNISASTANIGTLTVGTFSPTSISVTSLTATTASVSRFAGSVVSALTNLTMPSWDSGLGVFENSYITKSTVGKTTVSGALGLDVTGTLGVTGISTLQTTNVTSLSSSGDVQIGGNLTVGGTYTVVNSADLYIKDRIITIASGGTNSNLVDGAGITLGSTGYNLKFVSGSFGTSGDSWQFVSGSGTNFTDLYAGIINATAFQGPLKETTETVSLNNTNISKLITFANATGSMVVNLPAAGANNTGYTYKVKNVGTFGVTVKSLGGTIDGVAASTGVLLATQYAAASFVSDGSNWFVF